MRAHAPKHIQTHRHIETQEDRHTETDTNTCKHIDTAKTQTQMERKEGSAYLTIFFLFLSGEGRNEMGRAFLLPYLSLYRTRKDGGGCVPSPYPTLSYL